MNLFELIPVPHQDLTASTVETPRRRAVGGVSFLERPGDGDSLIVLHGIGSNSDSFAPFLRDFPPGPRIVAWDAPGYLSSEPLKAATPTARDYAGALEQFLNDLGIRAAHVLGHSLGTLIAAEFARLAPVRVASLTLAASAQGYGMGEGGQLPENAAKRLEALDRLGPVAFAKTRASRLVFDPDNHPSEVARVRDAMSRITPGGYAQAVHMLATGDLAKSVQGLEIEPGFIIGAEDQITPMTQTDAAISAWAKTQGRTPRCITIPGAGHAVYVQAQTAFTEAVMTLVPRLHPDTPHHAEGEHHG